MLATKKPAKTIPRTPTSACTSFEGLDRAARTVLPINPNVSSTTFGLKRVEQHLRGAQEIRIYRNGIDRLNVTSRCQIFKAHGFRILRARKNSCSDVSVKVRQDQTCRGSQRDITCFSQTLKSRTGRRCVNIVHTYRLCPLPGFLSPRPDSRHTLLFSPTLRRRRLAHGR